MTEDRAALADYIVYFGFDSSLVQASEDGKVVSVAGILNENLSNAVRIEGHCDERGTDQYNRELGSRRAAAVERYLVEMGVPSERIATRSFGSEKPAVPGHDETAWRYNRRSELRIEVLASASL